MWPEPVIPPARMFGGFSADTEQIVCFERIVGRPRRYTVERFASLPLSESDGDNVPRLAAARGRPARPAPSPVRRSIVSAIDYSPRESPTSTDRRVRATDGR